MEEHTQRVDRSASRSTAAAQAALDGNAVDPAYLARLLQVIREAIDGRGRMIIRFRGFDRLIQPHRLWLQPDGTFLLEAFQIAGGSEWGDMGARGFRRSALYGYEAWISFSVEMIETAEIAGGPFLPHPAYKAAPEKRYGEVDRQVPGRDEQIGQRRLFPDGFPVPQ